MNIRIMKLRPYQQEAINCVKRHKKNLITMPTGSGKSIIFKRIAKTEIDANRKVLFLVAGISILDQAIEKHFKEITKDVSKFQKKDLKFSKILCASIDTLKNYSDLFTTILNEYETIIIDEAHNCTAKRYTDFLEKADNGFNTIVGLTATAYKIGKKTHSYWSNLIKPITVRELIKQKYLVFPKCFVSQIKMDTKVKSTAGDFNNKELFNKNDDMILYGSIVDEYLKHGKGKKAVCFAINIEHSLNIVKSFNERGIKAVHADATTPLDERNKLLNDFENGDVQVLCNVNIFSTGIDIAVAEIGIMARPTKSLVLWIQQVGRLLRTHPNKEFATILDHGGNIDRLGHPIEDFKPQIEPEDEAIAEIKTYSCPRCYYVFSAKTNNCPMCNMENEPLKKEREIKQKLEAELVEYNLSEQKELDALKDNAVKWANWCYIHISHNLMEAITEDFSEYNTYNKKVSLFLKEVKSRKSKGKQKGCFIEDDLITESVFNILSEAIEKDWKKPAVLYKVLDFKNEITNVQFLNDNFFFPHWFKK